jgi:hypothetical protein
MSGKSEGTPFSWINKKKSYDVMLSDGVWRSGSVISELLRQNLEGPRNIFIINNFIGWPGKSPLSMISFPNNKNWSYLLLLY